MSKKYDGAVVLEETPSLVHIQMPDGDDFWLRREQFTASTSEPTPEIIAARKERAASARRAKRIGFRDSVSGRVIRSAA